MKPDQETTGEHGVIGGKSEIRHPSETVGETLISEGVPSPEEKRMVLRDRARVLAREPERDAGSHEFLDIIEFRLAYETYAVESVFVREVYPLKELTPLPGVPAFVFGLVNVRGQILSVVDLKVFFNLPQKGLSDLNKVIVLQNNRMEFGILADTILATRRIMLHSIRPAPLAVTGIGAEYLKGVTDEGMIVLDAEKILGDKMIIVHQKVDEMERE